MKFIKRITVMTVATVYAGYLIQQAARTRAERAKPKPRRGKIRRREFSSSSRIT